jgi:hypothetical protein
MKHQLNVMNKLHNQQKHLNELEYQIMVGKQFNQNLHQLQLMMKILIKVMMAVIIKN